MSKRVPPDHYPHPPQQAFLLLDNLEAFYGGAAGGGKSDALLMAALQYDEFPQYRALILRRTYPELAMPGAIMDRARMWLANTDAEWIASDHTFLFPSGARLTFAHAQYEDDVLRFASTEFHFIGIDEVTRFTERMYRFLFSRIRKTVDDPIPLRMRCASNPGDIGHEWVKERFVTSGDPDRPFIPARLRDNPSLDFDQYMRSLSQLHPLDRQRLVEGDWDASMAGAFFRREWFPVQQTPPVDLVRVVRWWDLAATPPDGRNDPDWTAGCKMGVDRNGRFYVLDMQRTRTTSHGVEALLAQTAAIDGVGVPIFIEQEPGASGKHAVAYFRRALSQYAVQGIPSFGTKAARAAPFASQAEAGNVVLINGPWVPGFLDEADLFPEGAHDDQVDAAVGAFQQIQAAGKAKQTAYVAPYRKPVVRRGDLVLVGDRYVDKQ